MSNKGFHNLVREWDIDEFLNAKFVSGEAIVEGLVTMGENSLIVAGPKAFKTGLSMQLAISVAMGMDFAEHFVVPKPRRVLYVAMENTEDELQSMAQRIINAVGGKPPAANWRLAYAPYLHLNASLSEGYEWLKEQTLDYRPELLVIDPLYKAHLGSLKDDGEVSKSFTRLTALTMQNHHATWMVTHEHRAKLDIMGKRIAEDWQAYFGSYVLGAWANNIYALGFNVATHQGVLKVGVERRPRFGEPFEWALKDTEVELLIEPRSTIRGDTARVIEQRMAEFEGKGYREIGRMLGVDHTAVKRAVDHLTKQRKVHMESEGVGKPFKLTKGGTR